MVSLPVIPYNYSVSFLFPDAVVVYGYVKGVGYERVPVEENLDLGRVYWVLLNEEKTVINIITQINE